MGNLFICIAIVSQVLEGMAAQATAFSHCPKGVELWWTKIMYLIHVFIYFRVIPWDVVFVQINVLLFGSIVKLII